MKKSGAVFALILAAVVLAFVIAEEALRIAGISYPNFSSFWTRDPYCGVVLLPGASGWWTKEGRAFVVINSDGMRDREHTIAKPPNTFRIAVLGDSYAEALQVSVQEAFWAVMQRELAACPFLAGRSVEALNFGVSGYGTAQELLMLRHRVWKYSPDLVLLAVTTGNDIRNNSRELQRDPMRPYFALSNGKVTLDDSFLNSREYRGGLTLPHRIVGRLIANSRVFQVIHRVLEAAREGKTGSRSTGIEEGLDAEVFAPPANPKWVDAWDVTDKLIEEMNDEVKEHRAIFLIVTLTSSIQVNPDCPARAALEKRLQVADLLYPDRRISALGRRDGFEVLNLPQPFLDYAQRNHVYLHGFRNTAMGAGHWNEDGHRLAGQLVAERVCEILQHEAPDSSPLAAPH